MTKQEHINYWTETAENDWQIMHKLYLSEDYLYSLFFLHLSIEKMTKAVWVLKHKENLPPKSHNLYYILEQSCIEMNNNQKDFLLILNEFNIAGRYPDYKRKIYKVASKEYTKEILQKAEEIKQWLLEILQ